MVLCDNVHRDSSTGKYTLLGTFSTLRAQSFPARVQFCVYYAVTDGLGPTKLRLRLVDAEAGIVDRPGQEEEGTVFDETTMEFDFPDPLVVLESVTGIQVAMPKPGLFHCELLANEELLMSRRLLAIQAESEEEKPDE
jgi:hypothetical protein